MTSVRGLYTSPPEEWVFLPPTVSPPSASTCPPTHLPSPFAPAIEPTDDELLPGLGRPLNLCMAAFVTTAMGMPFEVGKTLLQVEYRPRRAFAGGDAAEETEETEETMEETMEEEADAEMYFTDRRHEPTPPPPPADSQGYVAERESPPALLRDGPDIARGHGVWGMIRRVRHTPAEGLPALWKAQLVSTLHAVLAHTLQPAAHDLLRLLAPAALPGATPLTAHPRPALPLALHAASHLATHLLLAPLDTLRTRLILLPSHPSSPSSLSLFHAMYAEEGGVAGMYTHPNILFPAVLEHTLRPLFALSTPLILERLLAISPDVSPITYSLADLSLGLAHLLVLLPIETVRRRLQLQHRPSRAHATRSAKRRTIVRTRDKDYVGIVEALWRIIHEETDTRFTKRDNRDEPGWFAGVRQLYRGFGMAATAHATVFGLGLVSAALGASQGGSGWKEI